MEGKFDTVMGRDVLVTTGTYGFRTYDVGDAAHPKVLDTLQPPEVPGKNGYWQDEDMEIDTRRKLIIGALDPRHDDVDQTSCPGIGQLSSKNRKPECRSGFYVISYKDPRHLRRVERTERLQPERLGGRGISGRLATQRVGDVCRDDAAALVAGPRATSTGFHGCALRTRSVFGSRQRPLVA